MRFLILISLIFFFNNCSFDNKTGIWKNNDRLLVNKKDKDLFEDFRKITVSEGVFNKEIPLEDKSQIKLKKSINNYSWPDSYFNNENNYLNFKYNNSNQIIFKSNKLTRSKVSNFLIFESDNLILTDNKGAIIVYSIKEEKIISKFNFYRKRFKNFEKKLNTFVENGIIYVSDNFGFLYAYDYRNNNILWAQKNKSPFISNIKLYSNKIIVSDVNNNLIFFDKINGKEIKQIPTESVTIRNEFINNIALNKDSLFFLNTYGTIYSIDKEKNNINWITNLNNQIILNKSNIFDGTQVVADEKVIIATSKDKTFIMNSKTGSVIESFNFSSKIKPIINNNLVFL